jgi:hypothetical protein
MKEEALKKFVKIGKNSSSSFFYKKKKNAKNNSKNLSQRNEKERKKHKKWEFKNFSTNLLCTSRSTSD